MTSGLGDDTPKARFITAQTVLELAFRLHADVIADRIDRSIFDREVMVVTDVSAQHHGVRVNKYPGGTKQDLLAGTNNLILTALSASALTADETLLLMHGPLNDEPDGPRKNLRIMVSQLRNAFAHNPWRPKWVITKPRFVGVFPVVLDDGATFVFDTTKLNDDGVQPAHVGGIEFWIRLLQHCERQVLT
jgi:hypothetical protein